LKWKNEILKQCYVNLGVDLLEFFYIPRFDENLLNSFIKFENIQAVKDSAAEQKSIFFLSGHFSNWELMAFSFGKILQSSLKIIAKQQASKKLNEKINDYRESGGNEIIQIGYSLRSVYEKLNSNEKFCFLIDQSANPDYSVYVKFFGKNVATFSGPAKIALKKRVELIIAYGERSDNYSYKMYFDKLDYEDLKEYNDENVIKLTQRIQTKFEEVIRNNPGQWLWLHKRFKHTKS